MGNYHEEEYIGFTNFDDFPFLHPAPDGSREAK
jgi:hypothetical protein